MKDDKKSSGSTKDEEFACRLLKDHLAKQAQSAFDCGVNQQDPPDLIVTWANGLQWGVEVSRAYHQVPSITKGKPVSSAHNIALLRCFAKDLEESTKSIRKLEYSLFLEGAGPFSSWHKQPFKKWKKENEPKIRKHIESGDTFILKIPGVRLVPGKPGKRFSILASGGIQETSSARKTMLKRALAKAQDLPNWNGKFAERWLLLLNCYPLVDDLDDVKDTLRQIVFAEENLAGFDGIFWSGYLETSLRQIRLDR